MECSRSVFKYIRKGLPSKGKAPRVFRDLAWTLSLIKTVAMIRHYLRKTDDNGRLVADIADYETIYDMVNPMCIDAVSGVTPSVTNVVEGVIDFKKEDSGRPITYALLERRLGMHREQVSREVAQAISRGWLIGNATKPKSPRDIVPGEPMPDDIGLPTP